MTEPIGGSSQSLSAMETQGGMRENINKNPNLNILVQQFDLDINKLISIYGEDDLQHLVKMPTEDLLGRIRKVIKNFLGLSLRLSILHNTTGNL